MNESIYLLYNSLQTNPENMTKYDIFCSDSKRNGATASENCETLRRVAKWSETKRNVAKVSEIINKKNRLFSLQVALIRSQSLQVAQFRFAE